METPLTERATAGCIESSLRESPMYEVFLRGESVACRFQGRMGAKSRAHGVRLSDIARRARRSRDGRDARATRSYALGPMSIAHVEMLSSTTIPHAYACVREGPMSM